MERYQCPIQTHNMLSKGNLENIWKPIPINISIEPDIVENIDIGANCSPKEITQYTVIFKDFCDVFAWSYEEMLGIDPSIFEHEIKTYPNVKPVRQKLRLVNPNKFSTMKAEVENLSKVGFIYPVPLI